MHEKNIARLVVDAANKVHTALGPGLLKSIYETCLSFEIKKHGLKVSRKIPVPIRYDNITFDAGFHIDLLVENKVVVQLLSIEGIHPTHKKQIMTYIKLANKKMGLLINFSESPLKNGIVSLNNGSEE